MATLDGANVFGYVIGSTWIPNADAAQVNAFFGVNGTLSLYGGSRGSVILIDAIFLATGFDEPTAAAAVMAAEANLFTFADGLGHTYADPMGRVFDNVLFRRKYQADPAGIKPYVMAGPVYFRGMAYKMELEVLA